MATSMSRPLAVKPGTPTMATSARLACKATQLRGWVSAFSKNKPNANSPPTADRPTAEGLMSSSVVTKPSPLLSLR